MIVEEFPCKQNGKIKTSYKILCRCDLCFTEFRRVISSLKKSQLCRSCTTREMNLTRDPAIHAKMVALASNTWKGKTRVDVMGEERARIASIEQSKKNSGKNNPNYGGKYSRGFADRPITGKWEDVFGTHEANRRKREHSVRMTGTGNPMYGKPSPNKAGNGISGWWKNRLYFRSLLELSFILQFQGELKSAERKEHRVKYQEDGIDRTYCPDFVDNNGLLYEIKPAKLVNTKNVQAKLSAAPHVKIVTEKEIRKIKFTELSKLIELGDVKIDDTKMHRVKEK